MLTLSAAETVGKNLKKGTTVVLESTVYPGVTEEIEKYLREAVAASLQSFKVK
jgi:UDP-N-acetyl-D-mannosaminuronate dehydrogenase